MFFMCLCFAVFNIVKYLLPRKERSYLIIIFYVLVTIECLAHFLYLSNLAVYPTDDPFLYDALPLDFFETMTAIGSATALALGWLVTATMY